MKSATNDQPDLWQWKACWGKKLLVAYRWQNAKRKQRNTKLNTSFPAPRNKWDYLFFW